MPDQGGPLFQREGLGVQDALADGVKRRTRAGMGRCQAGFCSPRVMEILARELGVPLSQVTKSGGASRIILGVNKDAL